ncbi:hypothetical protein D3C80_1450440 [compost metagenome]
MPYVQRQAPGGVEQPTAGIGVLAQRVGYPLIARHIQHQATAAIGAATGVVGTGRHHHEALLHHLATVAADLEVERARQAEHQLCVVVAVDDQVVAVVA